MLYGSFGFFIFYFQLCIHTSVVLVSLGSKKELRSGFDTLAGSPKHRTSIVNQSSAVVDSSNDVESEITGAAGHVMTHQQSIDHSISTLRPQVADAIEANEIKAESLDKILENKIIKEKRFEFEKKLEQLRKKHDKEKIRVTTSINDVSDGIRIPTFCMGNKLIKRLSSKTM